MPEVNVALIGYAFMGKAHSNAYRQLGKFFPDLEVEPVLKALCGRTEDKVKAAADKFGFESYETDFKKLCARPDIDLIDVVTPGNGLFGQPGDCALPGQWQGTLRSGRTVGNK